MVNPSLDDWSEMLAERFFPKGGRGRPAYLAVDDDVLDELLGKPGEGAWSLIRVVRPQLRLSEPGRLFDDVAARGFAWAGRRYEGPSPILPCLAVCVLAASRMDASKGISPANYYERLRETLDLAFSPKTGYPHEVPAMFRTLHDWLAGYLRGARGTSTIPDHPHPEHIGYALSQVFFRESDRRKLTRFFTALRLSPSDAQNAVSLIPALREWIQRSDLSTGAKRAVADDEYRAQIISVVQGELRTWDSVERDPSGRPVLVARLLLRVVPRGVEWGLAAARRPTLPSDVTFAAPGGAPLVFTAYDDTSYRPIWFGAGTPELLVAALAASVTLHSDAAAMRVSVDPVTPLGPDQDSGSLMARAHIQPGVLHWVLVRDDLVGQVEDALREFAREGWSGRPVNLSGWSLLRDVFVDLPPSRPVEGPLRALVPSVDARPELQGGLRLSWGAGYPTYLIGGEPDLWVPSWAAGRDDFTVTLDGSRIEPVDLSAARYQLIGRGLKPGSHRVLAGWLPLTFELVDCVVVGPPWPEGCEVVLQSPSLVPVPRDAVVDGRFVCGAVVRDPSANPSYWNPVLLPYGAKRYVLIGRDVGEVGEVLPPPRPAWLESVGLEPQDFELFAKFPVAWIRIDWSYSGSEFVQLDPSPPVSGEVDAERALQWADYLLEQEDVRLRDRVSEEGFAEYIRTAGKIVEELG